MAKKTSVDLATLKSHFKKLPKALKATASAKTVEKRMALIDKYRAENEAKIKELSARAGLWKKLDAKTSAYKKRYIDI